MNFAQIKYYLVNFQNNQKNLFKHLNSAQKIEMYNQVNQ